MLCKLMKHRGVNLDFVTQAISDNWDEHDQEETTTHHILRRTESGQNNAPQQDVMWKVVGWVGIKALSRSVEAGCIRALVGRGASDISLISKGGRK